MVMPTPHEIESHYPKEVKYPACRFCKLGTYLHKDVLKCPVHGTVWVKENKRGA